MFAQISFIKKEHIIANVYTFYFKKPENFKIKSGQYGLFIEPKFARPHPFSFSSAPQEKYLSFTTDISSHSNFKVNLMKMNVGNKLLLLGPLQNFKLESESKKYVFLAQGIGITPFRALLKDKKERQLPVTVTLIHVAKAEHVFQNLTQEEAEKAYYPNNSSEFRDILAQELQADAFYIAGSGNFVKTTKNFLLENQVNATSITGDTFFGYKD